jgi:hypothetical protein
MDPSLADEVLDYLAWGVFRKTGETAEDDRALEGTDARDIDRILKQISTMLGLTTWRWSEPQISNLTTWVAAVASLRTSQHLLSVF